MFVDLGIDETRAMDSVDNLEDRIIHLDGLQRTTVGTPVPNSAAKVPYHTPNEVVYARQLLFAGT